jgi:hypothetical protein
MNLKKLLSFLIVLLILIGVQSIQNVCASEAVKKVLLVGDSQSVGPFGLKLDSLLRKRFVVETHASCGSILEWWRTGQSTRCNLLEMNQSGQTRVTPVASTPLLEEILERFRPDWVILQFGGNYRNQSASFIAKDIQTSLDAIDRSGAKCFFVTNPASRFKPTSGINLPQALLDAVGNRCSFFRSDLVTEYPSEGGDGYHYSFKKGIPIAQAWAEKVFLAFLAMI